MAKIDLKFVDFKDDDLLIGVKKKTVHLYSYKEDVIVISLYTGSSCPHNIRLDKSTAIKLSKALRTEINKIES